MNERDFIIHKLERPRVGELLLVHDIGTEALEKLASGVRRLSRDGQPKDAAAVYAAINRPELESQKFASVTVYIEPTFKAKPVNQLYGRGSNVTLIIDFCAVRDRLLIFNGDVGRLGKAVRSSQIEPSFIQTIAGSEPVGDTVSRLARHRHRHFPPHRRRTQRHSSR